MRCVSRLLPMVAFVTASSVHAIDLARFDFSGQFSTESRIYPTEPAHPGQRAHSNGFSTNLSLYFETESGASFSLSPYIRWDATDPDRNLFDLHEAFFLFYGDTETASWELRIGIDRVFWGVAEVRNIVDIINQTDLVDHPDEKSKLGQPMAHLTWTADWGMLELFALAFHRDRPYPGEGGRLRVPILIDDNDFTYESSSEDETVDFAARYSNSVGLLDFGLGVFRGTAREPTLFPKADPTGLVLGQHYPQITQMSLDGQLTTGPWLLKVESFHRMGGTNALAQEEDFSAVILGGEYSIYSIFGSQLQVGLIAEYNYDARGILASNAFQDDLFVAARIAFNDVAGTEILASYMFDNELDSELAVLKFSRRLNESWAIYLETLHLLQLDPRDPLAGSSEDSNFTLNVNYNF